ncbi:MAG: LPXTG cell wall anchor domain-containing protein, partial [Acidimicrobiales bacterium]
VNETSCTSGGADATIVIDGNRYLDADSGDRIDCAVVNHEIPVITITKEASVDTATVGEAVVYTLTARNTGRAVAPTVTISDTVPAPLTITAVHSSGADCSAGSGATVSCVVHDLPVGAATTATVTALVTTADGPTTNVATSELSGLGGLTDLVAARGGLIDTDSATVDLVAPRALPPSNLPPSDDSPPAPLPPMTLPPTTAPPTTTGPAAPLPVIAPRPAAVPPPAPRRPVRAAAITALPRTGGARGESSVVVGLAMLTAGAGLVLGSRRRDDRPARGHGV